MTGKTKVSTRTTETTPDKVICEFCNKPISRSKSVETGHGARCTFIRATLGDGSAQKIHRLRYTSDAIAENKMFVKLADVSRSIEANALTTVSRFVTAFGTDQNAKSPKHIALTPIYTRKRVRYIHKMWLNKSAQTLIATNQYAKVPARVTSTVEAALALCSKVKVETK